MTTEQPSHSIRTFVRSAWVLLAVQLAAAAAAVAVTAWATIQVRPLLAQRERLTTEIGAARTRIAELDAEERSARARIAELQARTTELTNTLEGARKATPVLTTAINAFHRREYAQAVRHYDEALRFNPGDPYIYNLKSYSQFKGGDVAGAVRTVTRGLELDPTYDWGYFDLARYQCAEGSPRAALATIKQALNVRGDPIRTGVKFFSSNDGEFRRLCGPILKELDVLAGR
jgi:tetratricopeptide (TPR) repeat protein